MYIKSIHFKSVKGFADQKFEFGQDGKYAGWHVFVGGNASGKSTVLKGLALALAGPQAGLLLMGTTAGWLRQGELHGSVSVEVERDKRYDKFGKGTRASATELKAAIEWNKPSHDDIEVFSQTGSKQNGHSLAAQGLWDTNTSGWFCAGYGPMRRLTGSSSDALSYVQRDDAVGRMITLFREDAALSESEAWLINQHAKVTEVRAEQLYRFVDLLEKKQMLSVVTAYALQDVMAEELPQSSRESVETVWRELDLDNKQPAEQLLNGAIAFLNDGLLPHNLKITQVSLGQVFLSEGEGVKLPMQDLSDGNRAVYALVLDLLRHFAAVYGTANLFEQMPDGHWQINKPGVVLIDEAESHLHPTWQQTLPEWLKAHFPQVQFIVSTHSPLIVQAADPGGIYVLPLQHETGRKARRLSEREYQQIKLGRAEKVLLGEAFGLQHTRSRWANQQIERWQWLDAKLDEGEKLTPKERAEYNKLKKQMDVIFEPVREEDIK